ncbi:unnamed protein product [Arabis nemorensis]|uniref:Uncharacterized protein n=1 Tax=Arabis nemorensis TaxID=586526 RepID=A0A565AUE7_9BRAS|nr:unnamed protein product [Arabis nemorensis]
MSLSYKGAVTGADTSTFYGANKAPTGKNKGKRQVQEVKEEPDYHQNGAGSRHSKAKQGNKYGGAPSRAGRSSGQARMVEYKKRFAVSAEAFQHFRNQPSF